MKRPLTAMKVGPGLALPGCDGWIAWQIDDIDVRVQAAPCGDEYHAVAVAVRTPAVLTGHILRNIPLGRMSAALRTRQFLSYVKASWQFPSPILSNECSTVLARAWIDNAMIAEWSAVVPRNHVTPARGRPARPRGDDFYLDFDEFHREVEAQMHGATPHLAAMYGVSPQVVSGWIRRGVELREERKHLSWR